MFLRLSADWKRSAHIAQKRFLARQGAVLVTIDAPVLIQQLT
jgi:hypothetical protein